MLCSEKNLRRKKNAEKFELLKIINFN